MRVCVCVCVCVSTTKNVLNKGWKHRDWRDEGGVKAGGGGQSLQQSVSRYFSGFPGRGEALTAG